MSRPQQAELQFELVHALNHVGQDLERQRSLLSAAIPGLDTHPDLQAWAMVVMAIIRPPEVPLAEDVAGVSRALEAVARVDDRLMEVFVLGKAGTALVLAGDPAGREVSDRVLAITGAAPASAARRMPTTRSGCRRVTPASFQPAGAG